MNVQSAIGLDSPRLSSAAAPPQTAVQAINEARAIVSDLFEHRQIVYWTDLAITLIVAYSTAVVYLRSPLFSALQVTSFVVCGFALFRAGSYVHEIAHMRNGEMLGFRIAWNLLCGIPMIMPSHLYENHIDHHNSHHYGTLRDGEYLPLGSGALREILMFFAQAPFFSIYIALRLLFSPLSFVHPKLRTWVLEHASSYVINFRHRLTIPKNAPRRVWAALEIACSLRVAGISAVDLFTLNTPLGAAIEQSVVDSLNDVREIWDPLGADVLPGHVRAQSQLHPQPGGPSLSQHGRPDDACRAIGRLGEPDGPLVLDRAVFSTGAALSRDAPPVSRHSLSQPGPRSSMVDGTVAGRLTVPRHGVSRLLGRRAVTVARPGRDRAPHRRGVTGCLSIIEHSGRFGGRRVDDFGPFGVGIDFGPLVAGRALAQVELDGNFCER